MMKHHVRVTEKKGFILAYGSNSLESMMEGQQEQQAAGAVNWEITSSIASTKQNNNKKWGEAMDSELFYDLVPPSKLQPPPRASANSATNWETSTQKQKPIGDISLSNYCRHCCCCWDLGTKLAAISHNYTPSSKALLTITGKCLFFVHWLLNMSN